MAEFMHVWKVLITIGIGGLLGLCFRLYDVVFAKPKKLRSAMMKQGINGPPPTLLIGNILDVKRYIDATPNIPLDRVPNHHHHHASTLLFPFFVEWRKKYGDVFMFSLGNMTILHVTQIDMIREMSTCRSLDLGKPIHKAVELRHLLGQGITTSNGHHWAMQRKLLAPPFFKGKIKEMINLIQHSAEDLSNSWNQLIEANGGVADIIIDNHLRIFSGDVILKASLGNNNYSKRKDIFSKIVTLQQGSGKKVLATEIPGMKYLPSKTNRNVWKLAKEMKQLVLKLVKERESGDSNEKDKDLLQIIIDGAKASGLSQDQQDILIVDNFKQIYLAAYETTATAATWCFMFLAAYPEWQERVQAEVLHVCQGKIPNADMILKMKQLDMVVTETLRLYSPVVAIARQAMKEIKIGDLIVPEGASIWVYVLALHTDTEIWGADALEFKPERFADGINGATKHPYCYMPFGFGSRLCIGQNMALMEIKLIIALLLSRFSFTLSPSYTHCLNFQLLVKPKNGVNICIKKLVV